MKVVYIAGKFRASTHYQIHLNIIHAEAAALKWWKQGYSVICPHLNTAHFQNECSDDVWLKGCEELVRRSDIVYMLKGWETSQGSRRELELAIELGKEIEYE
ncbi:MAG: DUF4406 domain-containing protein [Candidatus Izemoplasmatales bacterium]